MNGEVVGYVFYGFEDGGFYINITRDYDDMDYLDEYYDNSNAIEYCVKKSGCGDEY